MGYKYKQRILNRKISNGQMTPKEMFNILSHQGNTNQTNSEIHLIPVRMSKIKTPMIAYAGEDAY